MTSTILVYVESKSLEDVLVLEGVVPFQYCLRVPNQNVPIELHGTLTNLFGVLPKTGERSKVWILRK